MKCVRIKHGNIRKYAFSKPVRLQFDFVDWRSTASSGIFRFDESVHKKQQETRCGEAEMKRVKRVSLETFSRARGRENASPQLLSRQNFATVFSKGKRSTVSFSGSRAPGAPSAVCPCFGVGHNGRMALFLFVTSFTLRRCVSLMRAPQFCSKPLDIVQF
jgi:hypothetical protein